MAEDPLEARVQALLDDARARGQHYSSAHYQSPERQDAGDGLNIRLTALEQAVLELARAYDSTS